MTRRSTEHGVGLVAALLMLGILTAMGLGVVLTVSLARVTTANYDEGTELLNASDAALELVARELAAVPAWDDVLTGASVSTMVDGAPGPRRVAPGVDIDLRTLTTELTCGRADACDDAQVRAVTEERPWGGGNPRWRPFLHMPLAPPAPLPAGGEPVYIAAWIGDDSRELDDDPTRDGAGPGQEGRYMVRARIETFGPRGGRHAIEAELARVCTIVGGVEQCLPGVRVHSWHAVAGASP